MGTSDNDPLVETYQSRIGVPSTGDEAYGYCVFVLGVLAGLVGIAIAVLGLGLAFGPIIRLSLKRAVAVLSYLGGAIALVGVAWFFLAFQGSNWSADSSSNEVLIAGVYRLGIFGIVLGSIFVPPLTSPREEQPAAERRAATAEAERPAAELARIEASRSQFEIYEDAGGNHRWRLRHRSRNVIAASGQGYASRTGGKDSIISVRQNAPNAGVAAE